MAKEICNQIRDGMVALKKKDLVADLCRQALQQGLAGKEILQDGLLAAMQIVGDKFRAQEFYIPEVLVAARALKAGLEVLAPDLARNPAAKAGKVVLGTVQGDLHDIGKNLVGIMLTGAGFEVVDLGIDVSKEKFVEAAVKQDANAVAMSALLTTTMVNMKDIVEALRKAGFKGKIIIGGAPVTQEFADKVGADLYAADAAEGAVKLKGALAA